MKGRIIGLVGSLLSTASFFVPAMIYAQGTPTTGTGGFRTPGISAPRDAITDVSELQVFAFVMIDWIFWGLIVLTIIMVLVSAYKYATSGGDPEKTKTAGRTLLYAAIAVAVAIIARGLPFLIGSFLGYQQDF